MASTTMTVMGTTQNHQNSVQTIRSPSPLAAHAAAPTITITDTLYDAAGLHLGGLYLPLLMDGKFTTAYVASVSTRPVHDLVWRVDLCADPALCLGLVWMIPPPTTDPLTFSAAAVGHMVAALDAGQSVALHAGSQAEIDAVRATVAAWTGGGRV